MRANRQHNLEYLKLTLLTVITACMLVQHVTKAQCGVSGVIIGSGTCTYDINAEMKFYTNTSYTEVLDPVEDITLSTYLNMKVKMYNTSREASNLLLESCWATSDDNVAFLHNNHTVIEFPGCSLKRYRTIINLSGNSLSNEVTVRFPTFYLFPNSPQFYFHCTIAACDNCIQNQCAGLQSIPRTYTRSSKILSFGPIKRKLDDTTTSNGAKPLIDPTVLMIVAIVLGIIILVLIIVIIACLVYPHCVRKYDKRANAKGYNKPVLTAANHFYDNTSSAATEETTSAVSSTETNESDVYAKVNKEKSESSMV